ncbi:MULTISPECIES: hypothetical protein [Streptomyces]|uniref:Uncharacterized protein n=1 Tax=Streptomyces gilvifuscus TaxID=1550617 RepID=A0ABT5FX16_9ACTN|nr:MULTISPECIES: hypothetical protein [Streptomyces]MBK3639259.1 hypothetical protein [Streptomyces sp. MBT33]MDC2957075.1 hypothetical protein [Streptomyces gilvifuscus]
MAELFASALPDGRYGSAYGVGPETRPAPPGRLGRTLALGGVGAGVAGVVAGLVRGLRR